jgi:hypothetical protein
MRSSSASVKETRFTESTSIVVVCPWRAWQLMWCLHHIHRFSEIVQSVCGQAFAAILALERTASPPIHK